MVVDNNPEMKVAELIVEGGGESDRGIVQQLLELGDVQRVLATPLRRMHGCDVLHWRASRDGTFFIKTTYKMAMETVHGDLASEWED